MFEDILGKRKNEYKNSYFQHKIYYQDQSDWDCEMFGELNAEHYGCNLKPTKNTG